VTTATSPLSDDEIRAVADPLERGRILRSIAKDTGTLTSAQSVIWTATVAELAGEGLDERKTSWIARQFDLKGASRIRQILARARQSALATSEAAS
jgi:hypothetical protein